MNFKELKNLLIKNIKASQKVFLLSHNDIDLDGLGAIIGISLICKKYKKDSSKFTSKPKIPTPKGETS